MVYTFVDQEIFVAYRCESCEQPALETDVICWHCGRPLPRREAETAVADLANEAEAAERPFPMTAFIAYAGLTLAILIVLFAVMRSLGRQPQVAQGISRTLKPGWTAVNDHDRTFTMNLPAEWGWLDRTDEGQEADFVARVRRDGRYQAALAPYDDMADDRLLLLVAAANPVAGETTTPPFVLVARSRQLTHFTPEQMTAALRQAPAGIELLRSNLAESVNGRQQLLSILTVPYAGRELRCQHLFFNDVSEGYLIAGCSADDTYNEFTNVFHDILVSFQPLLP